MEIYTKFTAIRMGLNTIETEELGEKVISWEASCNVIFQLRLKSGEVS